MFTPLIACGWHYSTGFLTLYYNTVLSPSSCWFGFQDDFGNLICMVRRYNNTRLQYINNGVPLTNLPAILRAQDYGM